ncbi:MAG: sodium:solute symporter family protein [Methanosarcinales archaeon]|nr:sodium:solute symporter family protein [Methanosarcinales archaeon]
MVTPAIIIFYLAAVFAVGYMARGRDLDEFHLAGRSLGKLALTGTLCATILGASSTLGMAGLGYSRGLPGAWWMLSGTIGLAVLSFFLADKVRATGCYTLPEMIGSIYGQRARTASAILIALSWIGTIAAQIIASGKVLSVLFGGSQAFYMAASTAVFVLYTAHGGQRSVVRTDLIQFLVVVFGLVLLLCRSLQAVPLAMQGLSFPTSPAMDGRDVISMVFIVGCTYLIGPDIYSRLLSARDPQVAARSALRAALILAPLAFAIAALGISARALYPHIGAEQAIPTLMMGLLSPVERGLVAAALLAAFMSSADTTLLTATSILTLDVYRPRSSGKRDMMKVSRAGTLAVGSAALALAIYSPGIIATLLLAYTVFVSGMLAPVAAGFYRGRLKLTENGALAALIGGGATALLLGQSYPLAGVTVSALLLMAVSLLDGRASR